MRNHSQIVTNHGLRPEITAECGRIAMKLMLNSYLMKSHLPITCLSIVQLFRNFTQSMLLWAEDENNWPNEMDIMDEQDLRFELKMSFLYCNIPSDLVSSFLFVMFFCWWLAFVCNTHMYSFHHYIISWFRHAQPLLIWQQTVNNIDTHTLLWMLWNDWIMRENAVKDFLHSMHTTTNHKQHSYLHITISFME